MIKRIEATPLAIYNKLGPDRRSGANLTAKHKHTPSAANLVTARELLGHDRSLSSKQRGYNSGAITDRQKSSTKLKVLAEVKNAIKSTKNLHKRSKTGNNHNHIAPTDLKKHQEVAQSKNLTLQTAIANIDMFKEKFKYHLNTQKKSSEQDDCMMAIRTDRSYAKPVNHGGHLIKDSPYTETKIGKHSREISDKDLFNKQTIAALTGRSSIGNTTSKKGENKINFSNSTYGLNRGFSHGLIQNHLKINSSYTKVCTETNHLLYTGKNIFLKGIAKKESSKKLFDRTYHTRMKSDIPTNTAALTARGAKTARNGDSTDKNQRFGQKYISMKKKNQRESS
jgi:hypothetical protein